MSDDELDVDVVDHSDKTYNPDEFDPATLEADESGEDTQPRDVDSQPAQPDAIDWAALWDEFESFGSPDAVGRKTISETQLAIAIEVCDQETGEDPEAHISEAIEHGPLVEVRQQEFILQGESR